MIAIKDMEMPRSCFFCPYSKKGSILDGGYFCKLQILDGEISTYAKSQYRINGEFKDKQGCPLVEVEEQKIEKLGEIEQIIKQHDNDSMAQNYWYIYKIKEVLKRE